MGDLVRDAFQASGIDEEMEKVIADAILQKWNDEQLAGVTSLKLNEETTNAQRSGLKTPPITSLQDLDHSGLDCAKVRLLSEQLWRRLERKYEAKLQAWKKSEQKQLDAMLEKLRIEYRESIDAKQAQYDEMMRRKGEELRRMEDRLKEENRLEFEKRLMEVQREWREIEAERRDIRTSKDQFESAKNNFALRIENEEMRLRREKDAVERMQDDVATRARRINELIQNAVSETEKRERNWIAERVNEWNAREAKLTEKCERLCERVRQSGIDQTTIREQRSTIKLLQADLQECQHKLAVSEGKLADMQNKLHNVDNYEELKGENMKLKFEIDNGITAERLKAKEVEVANLERRLKLVEEAATLRVRELKLQLKLTADKLEKKSAECRRYRLSNPSSENVVVMPPSRTEQSRIQPVSLSDSLSSPSTNSSSSFDRNLRNRLKNLDQLSYQLDISLEKYRSGHHQPGRVHQRPLLLASRQMNVKVSEHRRNRSENRGGVREVMPQDEVIVPEVMRQDEVVVPEVMPQVALSTSTKPLMTSTPLSTVDERVTDVNVDRLTPLHETSAEAAMGDSIFPPIALPLSKTKQNDGNKPSEQREEVLQNTDVHEENSFEQRLRQRSERLRAVSAAESEQVERQCDQRNEENPIMQQYMNIVMQQRQKEVEENKAEDNTQNVDVSLVDREEANSASELDW